MNLNCLATDVNMSQHDVMLKIVKLCDILQREPPTFHRFSRKEYDLFRAYIDPAYLAHLICGDRKRKYNGNRYYTNVVEHIRKVDFSGCSTADVASSLDVHIAAKVGVQTVAAAMREAGYTSRMVTLDTSGRQGRRWFKPADVSFI